jgi:subtilisin family serine protease
MNHVEFVGSKVSCGFDVANQSEFPCQDRRGHGTMLAGLAGGSKSGVARGANLISVKIGHMDVVTSNIIAGCDFVTAEKRKNRNQPMVAVIASGPARVNTLLNQAVERMNDAGVFVTVAAGNDANDACLTTPGVVAKVTTVGSTTILDRVSNESCFGPCIDIFAPSNLLMVPWRRDTQYALVGGTSTAVPLVGGVAATMNAMQQLYRIMQIN